LTQFIYKPKIYFFFFFFFFFFSYLTMHVIHNWILTFVCFQAKEEAELPEYILGTVRLNRLRPDSATHFEI